jgi:hypothetical protein
MVVDAKASTDLISLLKSDLVEKKGASHVLHEQIATLNDSLNKMVVDGKVSTDLITVLESIHIYIYIYIHIWI